MIYGILLVGLLFTILTKGVQVRLLKDMFKQIFSGKESEAGVSSFQALSMALSGRVGTGNIAGTATAIAFGTGCNFLDVGNSLHRICNRLCRINFSTNI